MVVEIRQYFFSRMLSNAENCVSHSNAIFFNADLVEDGNPS